RRHTRFSRDWSSDVCSSDLLRQKPLTSLGAYECWLRGYQELKKGTLEADEQARIYFQQAMELDPHYPRAYTGMSLSYFNEWSCQIGRASCRERMAQRDIAVI